MLDNIKTNKRGDDLLRHVAQIIIEEPKRLRMSIGVHKEDDSQYAKDIDYPPCGTVGCIAGWAIISGSPHEIIVDNSKYNWFAMLDSARALLNLTEAEATKLFHVVYWAEPFKTQYHKPKNSKPRLAQITKRRIEYFIEHRM